METTERYSSDVAFTPSVKSVQVRKGSRGGYSKMEERGSWQTVITPDLAAFIEAQTSIFFATANLEGQPYIQHRGGPPGFLKVLDETTIGFADFAGNRQYITLGNLTDNPKAYLFLIDYAHRRRIKIWGEARVVEGDEALSAEADAAGLQGASRAGDPLHCGGVGLELPATYSAALRRCRCRRRTHETRRAHPRARGRSRTVAGGRSTEANQLTRVFVGSVSPRKKRRRS